MEKLKAQKCEVCTVSAPQVTQIEIAAFTPEVPGWTIVKDAGIAKLEKVYDFQDFAAALAFTVRVGALAEEEGHHPSLLTEWGRVTVQWWSHKIRGLHRNDFIMAAKTDDVFELVD